MIDNYHFKLIAAKLSGNITVAEEAALKTWMDLSVKNHQYFEEATEIWNRTQSDKTDLSGIDVEQEWLSFLQRIEKDSAATTKHHFLFKPFTRLGIAACITAIGLVSVYLFWQPKSETVTTWIHYTSTNEVVALVLPDSSRVWLNQNSSLYVQEGFLKRNVRLTGEAYFEVQPMMNNPFVVETENATTTVVGTSFNIASNDSVSVVTVLSGKVVVEGANGDQAELTKEEQLIVRDKSVLKKQVTGWNVQRWRKINNPNYEDEKKNISRYLSLKYTWKKNALNNSVLKGSITNIAALATYANINLEIIYKRPNGKESKSIVVIQDKLPPGASVDINKKLFDIFSRTKDIKINVKSVSVIEK